MIAWKPLGRSLVPCFTLSYVGLTLAQDQDQDQGSRSSRNVEAALPVVVIVDVPNTLDRVFSTASRLGIAARETPATIDTADAATMLTRGYQSVEQAVSSLPGVSSGGSPGSQSQFSMRGFTGDQITILRDGVYLGPAGMTYRSQNSFNLQGIEVLKGPGSALYGQGAIAGTVNVLTKKPRLGENSLEGVLNVGSFGSREIGVGGNFALGTDTALRIDLSKTASRGYIDSAPFDSTNLTLAALWQPLRTLSVTLGLDFLHDNPSPYWGTPLIPIATTNVAFDGVLSSSRNLTLDRRTRTLNYNVSDYQINSTQYLPTLGVVWKPSENVTIRNETYYFYADRKWINAESYTFDPSTGRVDRDRFFVFHNQHLFGNQFSASFVQTLAGLENRFLVGLDYSKLDFTRSRGFPDGDSIDLLAPAAGSFGLLVPRVSPTRWTNAALFMEDALNVTKSLKLVTGLRYEKFQLDRKNYGPDGIFQAASSFERDFKPFNWRFGAIYQLNQNMAPYVQYSTGRDPVGSNILLVNAGQNFDLSESEQVETGFKSSFDDDRANLNVAVYQIRRKNLLTQTSADTVANVGSQSSNGVELAYDHRPNAWWHISANVAYTDAQYGQYVDITNGVNAAGNRPANVPNWTANLWNSVKGVGGLPLELGFGIRHVAERFGNTENTLRLKGYTLLDLFAIYQVSPAVRIIGRVRNATDKAYVQWADANYPGQVQLGVPRAYEVGVAVRF